MLAPLLSSVQMSFGKLRQISVYFLTELSSAMIRSNFCDIPTELFDWHLYATCSDGHSFFSGSKPSGYF